MPGGASASQQRGGRPGSHGWDDAYAAAQLLGAMTREISVLEFDAGHRIARGTALTCS
jgi:hypothetical protein